MITLNDWQQAGRYLEYRGQRIFCTSAGNSTAPALLLIHGFPTASWDWEALWPTLAERFHVLTLDMTGFGLSTKPENYTYSLFDQADLFEYFLRARGISDYHILAHDYGDTVAQELLARQTDPGERPRLHSVCFLNGGLFPESHRPLFMQKMLLSPLGGVVARLTTKRRFAAAMQRISGRKLAPEIIDGFWALLSNNNGTAVMPKLIHYITERRQHRERWVNAIINSRLPVKVIDGAADPISGAHMVVRYRELVPKPDVSLLEGIGHYPQVEAPADVLAAYLAFREAMAKP